MKRIKHFDPGLFAPEILMRDWAQMVYLTGNGSDVTSTYLILASFLLTLNRYLGIVAKFHY